MPTKTSPRIGAVNTFPDRAVVFQFSLRALFATVTLTAIGLAVMPKDARALVGLLFVPQLGLAAWAASRAFRQARCTGESGKQASKIGISLAMISGLFMPAVVVLALLRIYLGLVLTAACFFSPLVTAPLILFHGSSNWVKDARLQISLLHFYNVLAVLAMLGMWFYIANYCGFD